jgi:hypothetical protein
MQPLDAGQRYWLTALIAGQPLESACQIALTAQSEFDVAVSLRWLWETGLVTRFSQP